MTSRWKTLLAALCGLAGCAPPPPAMAPDAPGREVAFAVGRIARAAAVADPAVIERELRLPGLVAALVWREPAVERGRGVLAAAWTPQRSELGIVRVAMERRPFDALGKPEVLKVLDIELEATRCPTPQVLRAALGVAPDVGSAPSAIGGEASHYTSFDLTADPRDDVRVVFDDANTCKLRVTLRQAR